MGSSTSTSIALSAAVGRGGNACHANGRARSGLPARTANAPAVLMKSRRFIDLGRSCGRHMITPLSAMGSERFLTKLKLEDAPPGKPLRPHLNWWLSLTRFTNERRLFLPESATPRAGWGRTRWVPSPQVTARSGCGTHAGRVGSRFEGRTSFQGTQLKGGTTWLGGSNGPPEESSFQRRRQCRLTINRRVFIRPVEGSYQ